MISYSGLTNYGKSSFPTVRGWNGSLNIMRDPHKSIFTKRKERVGDTNDVMNTLAHSEDRFIENINYFARGVNPMVSVSYGEAQTAAQTSNRGQSYLPYRIMDGGAFRPPIKRQEDLLPLSRLPRKWTTVTCHPTNITDHTKRLISIGTAKTTPQVKDTIQAIECETKKRIFNYPQIVAPIVNAQTKDNILKPTVVTNNIESKEVVTPRPLYDRLKNIVWKIKFTSEYAPSIAPIIERPYYELRDILNISKQTYPTQMKNVPYVPDVPVSLRNNMPQTEGHVIPTQIKNVPYVPDVSVRIHDTVPVFERYANAYFGNKAELNRTTTFDRLIEKPKLGGFEAKVGVAKNGGKRDIPVLKARAVK